MLLCFVQVLKERTTMAKMIFSTNKYKCDNFVEKFIAADTSSNDVTSIPIGNLDENSFESDFYCVVGSQGRNKDHDFKDGRGVRDCDVRPIEGYRAVR